MRRELEYRRWQRKAQQLRDRGAVTLSRAVSQQIVMTLEDGRQIVVTVVEAKNGRDKIHTAAPSTVTIGRGEHSQTPAA